MNAFERYRPMLGAVFCGPFIMGCIFMASILRGGSPVQPDDYGLIVYAIPGWIWALAQMVLAGGAAFGAFYGHPRVHAAGALGLGVLFEFFAAAAWMGGAKGILLVAMAIPAGALCLLSAGIGWGNGR